MERDVERGRKRQRGSVREKEKATERVKWGGQNGKREREREGEKAEVAF